MITRQAYLRAIRPERRHTFLSFCAFVLLADKAHSDAPKDFPKHSVSRAYLVRNVAFPFKSKCFSEFIIVFANRPACLCSFVMARSDE